MLLYKFHFCLFWSFMFVNVCYLCCIAYPKTCGLKQQKPFLSVLKCGQGWVGTTGLCSIWYRLDSLTAARRSKLLDSHVWCLSCFIRSNREIGLLYIVAWGPQENKIQSHPGLQLAGCHFCCILLVSASHRPARFKERRNRLHSGCRGAACVNRDGKFQAGKIC